MPLRAVRELVNATAFAASNNTPFLVHATIHWRHAEGFDPEPRAWTARQGRVFDRMSRWLRANGVPVAFAWAREVGGKKGAHTHLLLHLPRRHWSAFEAMMHGLCRFRPVEGFDKPIRLEGGKWGMWRRSMQAGELRYLLKTVSPRSAVDGVRTWDGLGVDDRQRRHRPVAGKRVGVSQTVSAKARAAAGWKEAVGLAELRGLLPTPEEEPRKPKRAKRSKATASDYRDAPSPPRWRKPPTYEEREREGRKLEAELMRDFAEAEAGFVEAEADLVEVSDADWRDAPEADFDVA